MAKKVFSSLSVSLACPHANGGSAFDVSRREANKDESGETHSPRSRSRGDSQHGSTRIFAEHCRLNLCVVAIPNVVCKS